MDFKANLLFLVASFLLLTTKVLSNNDVLNMEVKFVIPALPEIPVKVPTPAITTPPPYVKAPVTGGPPPPPPYVKAPVTAPPPPYVKPPVTAPVVKPPVVAPRPPIKTKADCNPQCLQRCSLSSRKNVCMRACVTCCERCRCVPPGPYGNREMCGTCYTGMTTHGNKSKCP